jgi:hypothetical protein
MQYRSDWPEIGLSCAINERGMNVGTTQHGNLPDWTDEWHSPEFAFRWVVFQDTFESNLYQFGVWNFHLELESPVSGCLSDTRLPAAIAAAVERLKAGPFSERSYLFTRVVKTEPLYTPLLEFGFAEVEERRLYRTRISDLLRGVSPYLDNGVCFASLADAPPERYESLRAQIFEISVEAFESGGFSRHFTDAFLYERLPGQTYIQATMELNFQRQQADSFLVAVDQDWKCLYGFSVVGRKPRLNCDIYTQLLSAVRLGYRDRDIYQGITRFLVETLPLDAVLLNATHVDNFPMQAAYQRSGRRHLADTVVMRRVFESGHGVQV